MNKIQLIIWIIIGMAIFVSSRTEAADNPASSQFQSYPLKSGEYSGRSDGTFLAYKNKVQIPGVSWLRLYFRSVSLSSHSYILITSLKDSAQQHFSSTTISQWQNTSAYFNGDAVELELFVAPGDSAVSLDLEKVSTGQSILQKQAINYNVSLSDNRVPSSDPAVGRIRDDVQQYYGTAWIAANGYLVTAGHISGFMQTYCHLKDEVLEFNVPNSKPNGGAIPSDPKDQYYISGWSSHYQNNGPTIGEDWGFFTVYPNSETGLYPIQAQQKYYDVEQNNNAATLRVTGYGNASGILMNTQQTATGPNAGSSGEVLNYSVFMQEGNSGGPVIDEATQKVVGIVTDQGSNYGHPDYNFGTSMYNTSLWNALQPISYPNALVYQFLSDNTTPDPNLWRWNVSTGSFGSISPSSPITVTTGSPEVFKGDQSPYNGQNYNNWTLNGVLDYDVINPHKFLMLGTNFTSHLNPVYNAGINSYLSELNSIGLPVSFIDPWLIDINDPTYGLRNEGMSGATPHSVPISANNLGISTSYKGVFVNQNQTFSPFQPIYSVAAPATQPYNGYTWAFVNWSATNGTYFQNSTNLTTPVVFGGSGSVITANYKGIHLSTNASAFSNNSQRKIVRTGNGWLHMVYESGGHVWYEVSTDNGSTWTLMSPTTTVIGGNVVQGTPGPLDIGGGKCPSIDYSHNPIDSTSIIIVFQQAAGTTYTIMQMPYLFCKSDTCPCNNGPWITENIYAIVSGADPYATTNANPTITWGSDGSGLLTWETKSNSPGIYYLVGQLNSRSSSGFRPGFQISMYPTIISGTSIKSTNATTSGISPDGISMYYDIAWEQDSTSTKSSIKHTYLQSTYSVSSNNYSVTPGRLDTISSKSISKNYKPSLIENDSCVICSWIGDLDGSGTWMNVYAYERQVGYSTIYRYGVGAQSVSMNKDNGTNYYLAWVQNSSYSQNPSSCTNSVVGSNLSAQNLNTTGQNIQLCNGPTSSKMYVSSFYNSALPYYFQTSNSLTSAPQGNVVTQSNAVSKANAVSTINTVTSGRGRGIAIDKGNTGFYYSVGNLNVDGNLIDFVSANSKANYNKLDTLNNVLLSQPFAINSNSVLSFSENSGAADTVAAAGVLGNQGYLTFTVQLVDNASGSVLGTVKKVKFSSSNLQLKYKTSPYTLPTTGLGGKTGRLKISVGTNLDSLRLALVEQYAGVSVSAMGQASNLAMQTTSASGITLGSYPNPFNPSTNIRYQLIENSRVSIKVYDILGRQITTLVDGNKTAGQYIAVFDGSHFASGVYFVRMMVQGSNAQQIVKTLKIQMLK